MSILAIVAALAVVAAIIIVARRAPRGGGRSTRGSGRVSDPGAPNRDEQIR